MCGGTSDIAIYPIYRHCMGIYRVQEYTLYKWRVSVGMCLSELYSIYMNYCDAGSRDDFRGLCGDIGSTGYRDYRDYSLQPWSIQQLPRSAHRHPWPHDVLDFTPHLFTCSPVSGGECSPAGQHQHQEFQGISSHPPSSPHLTWPHLTWPHLTWSPDHLVT